MGFFTFLSSTKAADTGAVAATVTAQSISLSVVDGGVSYGTLGVGSTKNTTNAGTNLDDSQIVTNTGNVSENFNIKGMNSTSSGVGWTLASSPGANTYTHKFCNVNCDASPTWGPLSIGYTELSTSIGVGNSAPPFDLQIYTPTSTTDYNEQTVSVTVQATL